MSRINRPLVTNAHGVKGLHIAWRGGYHFVPEVCLKCGWFEYGEPGDFGTMLTPPYCIKNLWFPRRKGTCKTKEKTGAHLP